MAPEVPTKMCALCQSTKPISEMEHFKKGGKEYVRSRCKACKTSLLQKDRRSRSPEREAAARATSKLWHRRTREDPKQWFRAIYYDTMNADRKAGRSNDIDPDFIRTHILSGCSYCGETELRMTLDRIDNDKGHTKDNVVPACIRCNLTRGSMPHGAWERVAKGMREAREAGLFGSWAGRTK